MPSNRKEMRQEKQKKRRGEKAKSKIQDYCVTFKPKNYPEILLSACTCPNFVSLYFASGSEGREVYDL